METYNRIDAIRVLTWINNSGGEITKHRLRRYRPRKLDWEPVKSALDRLIDIGAVVEYRNELEPIERGAGFATTRYSMTDIGRELLKDKATNFK